MNLGDLEVFVRAADSGSLSAAARFLDLSPAVASAALKRLEASVGVVLLLRSTRSLRLSNEGERFLPAARLALNELRNARDQLSGARQVIRDSLQISLPSDLGRNLMLAWLDEFLLRYPEVSLRLNFSDRLADIYRQPVDLAIRYGIPVDSALVAVPLLPDNRRVLCAAPAYIAEHGDLSSPLDLPAHNCLRFRLADELHEQWSFSRGDEKINVAVSGNRLADDGDVVRRWALSGQGIAYKSRLDVAPDLAAGRLVELCPSWQGELAPLSLVCADRRQLSPTVVLLREHLRHCCQSV
ncbi:LysR family transcriptional regulator [Dechloromonas sp. TW-R-39-2]|uniref:LysR family transcriptional regulator n=1 Tax=Dechloromonas sp. TW-R-39-2 TaxID=2654218 RepID=UPI00193CBEA5|nr:LysR family transcriptional regulator [Dechloromonas sp. TW-R-39-2]